ADDGVKPQTIEAINHAKAANVPILVAINKIDKPGVQINRVKEELSKQGIIPEEWGGEVTFVEISALKRKGIEDLLEMVALNAEILDLRADPDKPGRGVIIESRLDKTKGAGAKILIKEGKIKTGDFFISGDVFGKVRTIVGGNNKPIKEAGPSSIVEVYGFSSLPQAGSDIYVIGDNKLVKELSEYFRKKKDEEKKKDSEKPISLDDILNKMKEGEVKNLSLIIKADVQGSLEAIEKSLNQLDIKDVNIEILHKGIGGISEADVMLASASKGIIVGFNVRPDNKAEKAAQREKVEIKLYRVIYELIEDIERILKGLLEPVVREVITGKAEIRQVFKIPKVGQVAGCFVLDGKIKRGSKARLIRDQIVIKDSFINSLKRFKEDVTEVVAGYECGLTLEGVKEYREKDIIETYVEEVVEG
ncbi:MAG TPA: translation initiation factor IF-2, partial [Candidatus Atribacteria bacterium]|nr:translation initiation factor IF-2 [Candidatus Atribacteria bacterium]